MRRYTKNVLLLTSTNLACNPRCLKEVKLLSDLGACVTVVGFNLHNWTNEKEQIIRKQIPNVTFHYLDAGRGMWLHWLFYSISERFARILFVFFPTSLFLASLAVSKRSWQLLNWFNSISMVPDLIIAHNPPAFYPAYRISKKSGQPYALDIEDFHPGESSNNKVKKCLLHLMRNIIKSSFYTSYSSKLIKEYTERSIESFQTTGIIVRNLFSSNLLDNRIKEKGGKVKMVWFSQKISFDRGLEQFLVVFKEYLKFMDLTLIGNLDDVFYKCYLTGYDNIHIVPPMDNETLIHKMNDFDIGLALEPGKDLNNEIALSNKLLVYFQTGLFTLASSTPAQKDFLFQNRKHGLVTTLAFKELQVSMNYILDNIDSIRKDRAGRIAHSSAINWENESILLQDLWDKILR